VCDVCVWRVCVTCVCDVCVWRVCVTCVCDVCVWRVCVTCDATFLEALLRNEEWKRVCGMLVWCGCDTWRDMCVWQNWVCRVCVWCGCDTWRDMYVWRVVVKFPRVYMHMYKGHRYIHSKNWVHDAIRKQARPFVSEPVMFQRCAAMCICACIQWRVAKCVCVVTWHERWRATNMCCSSTLHKVACRWHAEDVLQTYAVAASYKRSHQKVTSKGDIKGWHQKVTSKGDIMSPVGIQYPKRSLERRSF